MLKPSPYKNALVIGGVAILFGLAHTAGGWQLMLTAGIAGVGYALAYQFGGLSAAILAHFGLNAAHFSFDLPHAATDVNHLHRQHPD